MWRSKLSGAQEKILDTLIDSYPDAVSRDEIARSLGVQADTGSFSNNLSKLRTLGLLENEERGYVRATDLLFPQGIT